MNVSSIIGPHVVDKPKGDKMKKFITNALAELFRDFFREDINLKHLSFNKTARIDFCGRSCVFELEILNEPKTVGIHIYVPHTGTVGDIDALFYDLFNSKSKPKDEPAE